MIAAVTFAFAGSDRKAFRVLFNPELAPQN